MSNSPPNFDETHNYASKSRVNPSSAWENIVENGSLADLQTSIKEAAERTIYRNWHDAFAEPLKSRVTATNLFERVKQIYQLAKQELSAKQLERLTKDGINWKVLQAIVEQAAQNESDAYGAIGDVIKEKTTHKFTLDTPKYRAIETRHLLKRAGAWKEWTELDLSHKGLNFIPSEIKELTNLRKLNLEGNPISLLPDEMKELSHLEELNIRNTSIVDLPPLPDSISVIRDSENMPTPLSSPSNRSQTTASSSASEISNYSSPSSISAKERALLILAEKLELVVQGNSDAEKVKSIREMMPHDTSGPWLQCEELDLSDSEIQELPEEMAYLKNLKTVDLSHNAITTLPWQLSELKNLEMIDCGSNQLKDIPSWIKQAPQLQIFLIDENPVFQDIEKLKKEFPNIQFQL